MAWKSRLSAQHPKLTNDMEKEPTYFWGVDVSKGWLDVAVHDGTGRRSSFRVGNKPKDILQGILEHAKRHDMDLAESVLCLEHTGLYGEHLLRVLHEQKVRTYVVPAMQIKKSMGVVRGKTDKLDADRIAGFIRLHYQGLRLWEQPSEVLQRLKLLEGQRARLVQDKVRWTSFIKELGLFHPTDVSGPVLGSSAKMVEILDEQIRSIEAELARLIAQDSELARCKERASSVPGVGPVLSTRFIVATLAFTKFNNPRQIACFAGTAPYPHESGSSIKGRSRVSHLADKSLKTLLHLAAMRAVQIKGELQDYYKRKVAQGKNPMSVLNAVRSKIIHRVFAAVDQDRDYSPLHPRFSHMS